MNITGHPYGAYGTYGKQPSTAEVARTLTEGAIGINEALQANKAANEAASLAQRSAEAFAEATPYYFAGTLTGIGLGIGVGLKKGAVAGLVTWFATSALLNGMTTLSVTRTIANPE